VNAALLIGAIVLADAAGDVLLTKGIRQVGEVSSFAPRHLVAVAGKAVRNQHILASLFCMAAQFIGFLVALSWADLSFVFPATALVYVVGTLAARFVLQETVSIHRWAGTMLVCLGVILVAMP